MLTLALATVPQCSPRTVTVAGSDGGPTLSDSFTAVSCGGDAAAASLVDAPSCIELGKYFLENCCPNQDLVGPWLFFVVLRACLDGVAGIDERCADLRRDSATLKRRCDAIQMMPSCWPNPWSCVTSNFTRGFSECDLSWHDCTGAPGELRVECHGIPGWYGCQCFVDGELVRQFESPDVCGDTTSEVLMNNLTAIARVNRGCGWRINQAPQ